MKKTLIILLIWLAMAIANMSPLYAPNLPAEKKNSYQVASSTSTPTLPSYYLARNLKPAESFGLRETPRKILIPESALPENATFTLTFDNPAADIVTQAKIYDITGSEVADMTDATGSGSNPSRLTWDGRDKDGSIVRSGIYIYQVQAGGTLINGTVVVAR